MLRIGLFLCLAVCLLALIGQSLAWQGQFSIDPSRLAVGNVLVSMRELPDPNFTDTVVVLTHYDSKGTVGLILNRRSTIRLSRLFPEIKDPKRQQETVFQGGPVTPTGIMALLQARVKPEGATKILNGIFLVNDSKLLEKSLATPGGNDDLRVYLGYAGWGPGQLERESGLGAWFIFPGNTQLIFDPNPGSLWPRLIHRTELRYALNLSRPSGI